MITDDDVRRQFQGILNTPGGYMGSERMGRIVQIFRGALWKDDHPGACQRHMTVFNKYGVIPKHCFDCYKVVVKLRNALELFKLLMVFEKISLPNNNTRKVMVEGRTDCSGTYKGFVYCRSIEEGNEVREIVRNAVASDISPEVPVEFKRGCSEYARVFPGYAEVKPAAEMMRYNEDWKVYEDLIDKNVVFPAGIPRRNINSTEYSSGEIYSMQYWLRYAATIGDLSYLKVAGRTLPPLSRQNGPSVAAPPK